MLTFLWVRSLGKNRPWHLLSPFTLLRDPRNSLACLASVRSFLCSPSLHLQRLAFHTRWWSPAPLTRHQASCREHTNRDDKANFKSFKVHAWKLPSVISEAFYCPSQSRGPPRFKRKENIPSSLRRGKEFGVHHDNKKFNLSWQ